MDLLYEISGSNTPFPPIKPLFLLFRKGDVAQEHHRFLAVTVIQTDPNHGDLGKRKFQSSFQRKRYAGILLRRSWKIQTAQLTPFRIDEDYQRVFVTASGRVLHGTNFETERIGSAIFRCQRNAGIEPAVLLRIRPCCLLYTSDAADE